MIACALATRSARSPEFPPFGLSHVSQLLLGFRVALADLEVGECLEVRNPGPLHLR